MIDLKTKSAAEAAGEKSIEEGQTVEAAREHNIDAVVASISRPRGEWRGGLGRRTRPLAAWAPKLKKEEKQATGQQDLKTTSAAPAGEKSIEKGQAVKAAQEQTIANQIKEETSANVSKDTSVI